MEFKVRFTYCNAKSRMARKNINVDVSLVTRERGVTALDFIRNDDQMKDIHVL